MLWMQKAMFLFHIKGNDEERKYFIMINRIQHIQDFLNGKRKKEIEQAIAGRKLVFDYDKYRLVKSERTISGYIADFTEAYKSKVEAIYEGFHEGELAKEVYIKTDSILSDGYEFFQRYTTDIYIDSKRIYQGKGKSTVSVYEFALDEQIKTIVIHEGMLLKGSIAMIESKSNMLEARNEEFIERCIYIDDMLGTGMEDAAALGIKFDGLDDDEFDATIELLCEMSMNVAQHLSIKNKEKDEYELILADNRTRETVLEALKFLAGSKGEYLQVFDLINEKNALFNAMLTKRVLLAGIRHKVKEIMLDEDIEEYRAFISTFGRNPGGATCDISELAEITGMQQELANFLLCHGEEKDFIHYLTQTRYIVPKGKSEKKEIDPKISSIIYQNLHGKGTCLPLSYKYMRTMINLMNVFNSRNAGGNIMNDAMDFICDSREVSFNIISLLKSMSTSKGEGTTEIARKILIEARTEDDVAEIIGTNHVKMDFAKSIEELGEILKKGKASVKEMERIMGRDGISIEYPNLVMEKEIYGVMCRSRKEIPDGLKGAFQSFCEVSEFEKKCKESLLHVISNGIESVYQQDGLTVTVMAFMDECTIQFDDGKRKKIAELNDNEKQIYFEKVALNDAKKRVEDTYRQAMEIKENGGDLREFFGMDEHSMSNPDGVLDRVVRLGTLRVATDDKATIPEYLIGDGNYSIKVPELPMLQNLIKEEYLNMIEYHGILKCMEGVKVSIQADRQHGYFDNLFHTTSYSVSTGMPLYATAMSDLHGNVYQSGQKLFYSEHMESLMARCMEDDLKATEEYRKYVAIKSLENESVSCWDAKISFVEECVEKETISKKYLFKILYDLSLDKDSRVWLKSLLDGIDQQSYSEYLAYEEERDRKSH